MPKINLFSSYQFQSKFLARRQGSKADLTALGQEFAIILFKKKKKCCFFVAIWLEYNHN
jgi:hypothetical protein